MIEKLKEIEVENNVTILFACEAGSRAWQSATNESDYDIRFIYKHNDLKSYVTLAQSIEVIDFNGSLDIHGWDIKKALKLLMKSNPSIYEWSFSPTVYKDVNGFSKRLRETVRDYYSPFALCMHYLSLIHRNLKDVKVKNGFNMQRQKQLIQVLRAMLLTRNIMEKGSFLLNEDFSLVSREFSLDDKLGHFYSELVQAKIEGIIMADSFVEEVIPYLEAQREIYLEKSKFLTRGKDMTDVLNAWLWELLEI